tara:strand:- start:914 stop:2122 length:1209 start_codon:yes stop_codon:yes gene_type:complete
LILTNNQYLLDSNLDPLNQLSLLKEKCNNISSHLYRVKSLYLEELRRFLPQAIRTSLLSLMLDKLGDDFSFSTVKTRKRFQLKVDKLVSDTISILTIEHLNELAKKIDEENFLHFNNAKDEMAKALNMKEKHDRSEAINDLNSINISAIPPLENLSITEGWNGELKFPYSIEEKEPYSKSRTTESESYYENTNRNDNDSLRDEDNNSDTYTLKSNDIEILQSIFTLKDESNLSDLGSSKYDSSNNSKSYEDFKNKRLLPQSPIGLYEWMLSIDIALTRRLRDLSHSINTELLKSGLLNTLVPLNILDAALSGQLISSKSISNLLTLKLPTNSSMVSGGLDIDCLLITSSDMEFDNPRLRKNRTNIKYYQNVLLGMIKQQRYWQGRSIIEEVNKEWWKDTSKI